MAARVVPNQLFVACFCVTFNFFFSHSSVPSRVPIGIHPLDEKYYDAELIKCKDGSKSFARNRLNDDFCDCPDGTDEPGTSACPSGKFYCRNMGSTPRFLFSSRVNDQICDCCDGSDEYDGNAICPNTCVRGGNIVYQRTNHDSVVTNSRKTKHAIVDTTTHEIVDTTHKPSGLKTLVFLQMTLVLLLVAFLLYPKRKTKRRTSSM